MKSKWTTAAALMAACAVALSACARGGEEPGAGDTTGPAAADDYKKVGIFEKDAPGEPKSGGTLTYADFSETRSLDPARAISTGYAQGTTMTALYDTLVRWNERTQELEPRLAESVEPNDDFSEWTIKLRPGATFSDGTPVNADAVIGSFNYYIENKGFDLGVVGAQWAGATKVDDSTVLVKLQGSWATFPFALGMGMGWIVAPAAIADGPENFKPIGAGAFTFESYRPQEELVMAANPNYWDGKPYLDKLRFVWLQVDETKYDSLTSGSVHAALIRDVEFVKKSREADQAGWVTTEGMGKLILINRADGNPAAEYPQIAPAMAHAVDGDTIIDRVFDGAGLPTRHLFPETSKWYNEDAKVREYDPDKARELLDEAKAAGFDGKIQLHAIGDPVTRETVMALTAQLESVGFTVEQDFARTVADSTAKVHIDRSFQFAASSLSLTDPNPYWRLFSGFSSTSRANVSSFSDPEMNALLDELRATAGDDRRDVLNRIENRFLETVPAVTWGGNINMLMWSDKVHGITPSNDSQIAFDKAWISN